MTTNDYLNISTLDELRAARNSVSAAIKASERKFTGRIDSFRRYFSLGKILLILGRGRDANAREHHTPPIFTFGLTNLHP